MNLCGITDSLASVARAPRTCPSCGAAARVNGGECLSCLLQTGLAPAAGSEGESLDALLAAIEVRDSDWRLGNYQILEEVGRGGMGVIYRARQRHSKRIVALKRVLSYHGDSRETLERFRREAEAAASLDHPNILPIYEVAESEGLPFFTMKFATGGSLREAAPALSAQPRECVRLLAKVTRAVAYAHREGILHRDLKPGNILLDARGEPLVSDFGLAKWIDASSDLTRSLTIFGTPGYIAPEQANGPAASLTPAADVYSLGAILFDLLTGQPPFLGEHALAVIRQAAEKPAPKLRSLARTADRDLETVCAKCLEREPRARYRTAADLAEDLERWLEGRAIVARPVSPPAKLWRWSKRNPLLAGAAASCLLLAGIGIARQAEVHQLATVLRESRLKQQSVTLLPILDLESVSLDSRRARAAARKLEAAWTVMPNVSLLKWPADGDNANARPWKERDLRDTALRTGARTFLMGTIRQAGAKERLVLTLVDAGSGQVLGRKATEGDQTLSTDAFEGTVQALYADWTVNSGGQRGRRLRLEPSMATANDRARDYLVAGDDLARHRNLENLDRAIECYRKAIAADPGCALAYANLASTMGIRTQFRTDATALDEAGRQAARAVALDPELPEGYRAQAVCFTMSARFEEAIEALLRAIELDLTYQRAPGLLGGIGQWMGRPDQALLWFRWAERLQTQPGEYSINIGRALASLGLDNQAEAAFREGAEFRPELPDPLFALAMLRLDQERFEEAYGLAVDVSRRFPAHELAAQVAAESALFTGRLEEAEERYRVLLTKDRDGGVFSSGIPHLSALGWLLLRTGRNDEGRTLLQECENNAAEELRVSPHHPKQLYALAGTLAASGRGESALRTLEEACSAGWIDYRATRRDPRFSMLREHPLFIKILNGLTNRVEQLRNQVSVVSAQRSPNER